jgi:hypothetical protein
VLALRHLPSSDGGDGGTMTRKRRAPNYTGALAQPIYVEDYYTFTGPLGQASWELDIDAIRKRAAEKVRLLYKHYKIDPSAEQSCQELMTRLAFAHVPGLQLTNRPKSGRKPTWKAGLGDEWVRAVDDVKSRTGKSTNKAIAELLKEPKWKTYMSRRNVSPQNLEARYWQARGRRRKLASLQEDCKKGIVFGVDLAALSATAATGRSMKIGARAKTRRKLAHAQKRRT